MPKENTKASTTYCEVSELAGDEGSEEQIERICNRYFWAADYVAGKDVVEVACGSGFGLNYLAGKAKTVVAGDISAEMMSVAEKGAQAPNIELKQFGASELPFEDNSKDVIICFEAIYYFPDIFRFISECKRVLRSGGKLLIATANKDLFDFNPSPFSQEYYGVVELHGMLESAGYQVSCFGQSPIGEVSARQKLLRPIKKLAVWAGLVPKTMAGKKRLKRLVFGGLKPIPQSIDEQTASRTPVSAKLEVQANKSFKVILCEATV